MGGRTGLVFVLRVRNGAQKTCLIAASGSWEGILSIDAVDTLDRRDGIGSGRADLEVGLVECRGLVEALESRSSG